ncbi:MAG TPA: hypothetical protein VKU02_20500 [Gemmataceae bacterium]|nr:hypothetical protein [Gemmataceae bacterium]
MGKRPGLAYQPANNVPVVDPMLVLTPQTRQALYQRLGIPDLDLLHPDPRLDFHVDQPCRRRVRVVLDVGGSAPTHALPFRRLQTPLRQRPHAPQLRCDFRRSARIPLPYHPLEE